MSGPSCTTAQHDVLLQDLFRHEGSGPVETDPTERYLRYPQVLGKGACKRVYKAFDQTEGIEVAWNQVELLGTENIQELKERLAAEIRVLKQLKHRNIITFYDWWYDPHGQCVNFITEYFTSGTLRQFRKRNRHITEHALKRWAWQIVEGLVYMHGHTPPVIHRDLKCDNIFVNGTSGHVKIGDLGLATCQTRGMSVVGTPEFMAPEIFDEQEYNERVDIYSFGMCLLELATMEYPYSECHGVAQIFKRVMQGVPPAAVCKVSSPQLQEIIRRCIAYSPADRPTARQLLKHPFFDSIRLEASAASPGHIGMLPIAAMESAGRQQPRHTVCVAAINRTQASTMPAQTAQDGYCEDSDEEVLVPLEAIQAELSSRRGSAISPRNSAAPPIPRTISNGHAAAAHHYLNQAMQQRAARSKENSFCSPQLPPLPPREPSAISTATPAQQQEVVVVEITVPAENISVTGDSGVDGAFPRAPPLSTAKAHAEHRRQTSEVHAVLTHSSGEAFDVISIGEDKAVGEGGCEEGPSSSSQQQQQLQLAHLLNITSCMSSPGVMSPVESPRAAPAASGASRHKPRVLIVRRKVAQGLLDGLALKERSATM